MDFFERQDQARRHTKLLVVYFALAVAGIIASVYLVCLLIFTTGEAKYRHYGELQPLALWNPTLLLYVATGTLGVIICGSLYKTAALAEGGSAVAEAVGGQLVNPNTHDPAERRLRNVVEEMSIASGVPVPKIYVLDEEGGINAFAAGHTPSDAAIAVTRGTMKLLSRDELQGVIGHEFSHLLNGDMRLNIRLIGIIFGILCLATIGRILLRTRGRKNALPVLGLALILIGAIGVFFGRLIQAAVSRQREFLADASSVQFTRNPAGLSGALQKIGSYSLGSQLVSEHAPDMCHMFFGNGVREPLFNLMATHPPLQDRIRAIDPTWDGKFKPAKEEPIEAAKRPAFDESKGLPVLGGLGTILGGAILASGDGSKPPVIVRTHTVLPSLGNPTPMHLHYAAALRNALPQSLQVVSREPQAAVAAVYAMLLSSDETLRATQLKEIAQRAGTAVCEKTTALYPDVAAIASRAQLPLATLALPALRHLSPTEFDQFSQTLQWLIESDGKVELFEFVLQKIVLRHLTPQFRKTKPPVVQFYTLKPLVPDCQLVLSALAQVGSDDPGQVAKAFAAGAPYLRVPEGELALVPREQCGLDRIDAALDHLAQAVPQIKKNLIEASVHTVGADGVIQEPEAELLRAVADTLDCPTPPFLQIEEPSAVQAP